MEQRIDQAAHHRGGDAVFAQQGDFPDEKAAKGVDQRGDGQSLEQVQFNSEQWSTSFEISQPADSGPLAGKNIHRKAFGRVLLKCSGGQPVIPCARVDIRIQKHTKPTIN